MRYRISYTLSDQSGPLNEVLRRAEGYRRTAQFKVKLSRGNYLRREMRNERLVNR